MKRRKLCNTKKLIAVILAASMVMGTGATAFAEYPVSQSSGEFMGEVHKESDNMDSDNSQMSGKEYVDVYDETSDSGRNVTKQFDDIKGGLSVGSYDVRYDIEDKDSASANVTVNGDVGGEGVEAYSRSSSQKNTSASTEVTIDGSVKVDHGTAVFAEAVSEGDASNASTTVTVTENVEATGDKSTGIMIGASEKNSSESNSSVKVSVGGDVTAADTAVKIFSESSFEDATSGSIERTVEGNISGGEHNIVVIDDNVSLEDVNITVWKVDTSKPIVETYTYNHDKHEYEYGANNDATQKAEESINYIIRVEPVETSGGNLVSTKNTAHAGEEVYLEVTVPAGYQIDSFFNAAGAANVDVISSGGKYYLKVPSGGGVDVGVRLTRTSNDSDSYSGSDSDSDYWSSGNNDKGNVGGLYAGFEALQGLQVHSTILGGSDVAQNIADVLTPVDTLSAMNNFEGTSIASIDMNNVMGAGVVNFNNMFVNSISDTVDVPVPANVVANQSYTVMFSDGTSIVVPCLMNGVLSIPFKKGADGLTYIICKTEVNPSMFIGMPPVGGWTY